VPATVPPVLLLATTNPGKVREIQHALAGLPGTRLTLADIPSVAEPSEDGRTFADNAHLKARYYASASGLPTVAEDSGLAIDALGGRPGVESARYPGATYREKFDNLYRELSAHPRPWTARFVCALAYIARPTAGTVTGDLPIAFTCEGTVEGEISPQPRGMHGFGYDPIFWYPGYRQTLGEVSDAEKLAVSHRGAAFRQFRAWLEEAARA